MQASNIPVKIGTAWGASAGPSYIRTIPVASQIGVQDGAASYTDGFPPWCFAPGGAPLGEDMNGILQIMSKWLQWTQAGAPVSYDAAYATSIGGYPAGALIQKLSTPGQYWYSTVDNNTSNPDTGGAGWSTFGSGGGGSSNVFGPYYGVDAGAANAIAATVSPTLASYQDGQIYEITPVAGNTSATVTMDLSTLGGKSVVHADGTSLLVGEITAGAKQLFAYDGSLNKIVFLGISPQRMAVVAQQGAGNWCGTFGGTVNALTASVTPAVTTLTPGLVISGLTSGVSTASATLTLNGVGPNSIIRSDGAGTVGGELNGLAVMEWDGSAWRITSMMPLAFLNNNIGNMVAGNFAGSPPANTFGQNGQYAFDYSRAGALYGPKSAGAWPSTPVWAGRGYATDYPTATPPIGALAYFYISSGSIGFGGEPNPPYPGSVITVARSGTPTVNGAGSGQLNLPGALSYAASTGGNVACSGWSTNSDVTWASPNGNHGQSVAATTPGFGAAVLGNNAVPASTWMVEDWTYGISTWGSGTPSLAFAFVRARRLT